MFSIFILLYLVQTVKANRITTLFTANAQIYPLFDASKKIGPARRGFDRGVHLFPPPACMKTDSHMQAWAATALGKALIEDEERHLRPLLSNLFGPIAVQMGPLGFSAFIGLSNAVHRICAADHLTDGRGEACPSILNATAEAMPFAARSISLVLLPHVLEFSDDPHQVLREAARVLVPEGHMVLIGFNPFSIWGVRRSLGSLCGRASAAPWNGRFIGLARVKEWVSVLGFEIVSGSSVFYIPPLKSENLRQKLNFLQGAGARWWPMGAASFIMVARKREFGLTPIVPRWRKSHRLAPGLAEPVTRNG